MSKQRFRLADLASEKPQYYHATFKELTHKTTKTGKRPVILLTDIYLVDKNDKKIRLAKDNDFKDENGRHLLADHCWVSLTKPWFLNDDWELLAGDEVMFKASIKQYKINRTDVLEKRDQIWNNAQKKTHELYERWSRYTNNHRRKNFQSSLMKLKRKQKRVLEIAHEEQEKIELVDYTFNRINHLKCVKTAKVHKGWQRENWNYDQYRKNKIKYTSYLAARSIKYNNNETWEDSNEN